MDKIISLSEHQLTPLGVLLRKHRGCFRPIEDDFRFSHNFQVKPLLGHSQPEPCKGYG